MAKNTASNNPGGLKNVEETLTRTEQFLEENYKPLLILLGVLVVLVGLFYVGRIYLNKRNLEAQSQIFMAERWLENDSINLALNGDGNYLGFSDIAATYKFTKTGNLANFGAGVCLLRLGRFEEALETLGKYTVKDRIIGSLAIGAMGDALVELDRLDEGAAKYLKAAETGNNQFNTPLFLMKAAQLYEIQKKYSNALDLYERIRDEFPESNEGTNAEKYIARIKLLEGQQ